MYDQSYPEPGKAPISPGPVRGTNVMAILSLVFAFVVAPAGIVFGHIARRQIRQTGEDGAGLATAGLVLSYVFTAFYVLSMIFMVVLVANAGIPSN